MIPPFLTGMAYFACVFAAGCVLGTIRALCVAPAIGELAAVFLELPIMLGWSWIVCGWLPRQRATLARLIMGATGFALLMAAELVVSLTMGQPVRAWLARFTESAGLVGLLGQIGFAAIPLLRWR